MDEREALLALNMVEGIGPIRMRELLDHFGDAPSVLKAGQRRLLQVNRIGEEIAVNIEQWERTVDLKGELKRIGEFGCHIITQKDGEYPELLREIYDPPMVLYVRGRLLPEDKYSMALVGARRTTHYGLETARKLAWQLGMRNVTVVSGGARGIDSSSHQGALSAKGRTISVLGTGINIIYPPENRELYEQITGNGAVITQFPFNRRGDKQTFPIRNRIVAGMTVGTVVVEAGSNSGALITANMALDNNRQVFAVPGRIDSPQSRGCHNLIKNGAILCEDAEDIVREFEYLFGHATGNKHAETLMPPPQNLPADEQAVYNALSHEEMPIDDIINATDLPTPRVSVALLKLEMKHLASQFPGKLFTRR